MTLSPRRVTSALLAAAMILSLAPEIASAQVSPGAPTVGPAGGVASTTAPANGQGTPSGGTGVISTTRVGPSGVSPAMPVATSPAASPTDGAPTPRRRRVRRHRRHYSRPAAAAETGTQSQAGTNGAAAPSAH